jgi:hypothetical protein
MLSANGFPENLHPSARGLHVLGCHANIICSVLDRRLLLLLLQSILRRLLSLVLHWKLAPCHDPP